MHDKYLNARKINTKGRQAGRQAGCAAQRIHRNDFHSLRGKARRFVYLLLSYMCICTCFFHLCIIFQYFSPGADRQETFSNFAWGY